MASANARRIARLEARRAAVLPNVVSVRSGETDAEAYARHGRVGPHILVPERCGEDEIEQFEAYAVRLQRELIAAAKSPKKEEGNDNGKQQRGRIRIIERDAGLHAGKRPKGRRICSGVDPRHAIGGDAR